LSGESEDGAGNFFTPSRERPDVTNSMIVRGTPAACGRWCVGAAFGSLAAAAFFVAASVSTAPLPAAEPTFAEQAAAVRAGSSTRIRVVDRALADEEWMELATLEPLLQLDLQHGIADDAKAVVIARLPALERLVLRESPLSDEGLRHLAACHTLRDVNIPQARCTLAGLAALAELPRLKNLRLGSSELCPEGQGGAELGRMLLQFPALRSLHLIDVPLGDAGLEGIGRYDGLWNLYLDGAGVSDGAWERYFALHPEVHVHVDQAHHDRDPNRHE
jgi:hypothetical protein